jgi:hypothetical protein
MRSTVVVNRSPLSHGWLKIDLGRMVIIPNFFADELRNSQQLLSYEAIEEVRSTCRRQIKLSVTHKGTHGDLLGADANKLGNN